MNVRRLTAALTVPCLCLAAQAAGAQTRLVGPPNPAGPAPAAPRNAAATADTSEVYRLRPEAAAPRGSSAMLQSWAVDANAEVGLGRFTVPNGARPRTHTERIGVGIDPDTRRIAGAGMQIRF